MNDSTPSRRQTLRGGPLGALAAAAAVLVVIAAATVSGCGSGEATPSPSPSVATIKPGGTLRVGVQAGNGQFDPVLMAEIVGDTILIAQVQENLIDLARDFRLQPVLATEWTSEDAKTWEFTLRDGVAFTNGRQFTSADVVYSFERLRSRELGSPMADTFANIQDVVAEGPTHVTFVLKAADAEFPNLMTDQRSKMLCRSVQNPMKELVGTGPFMLSSYVSQERAVLKKNPEYWGKDETGVQLPYVDEIDFIYSHDVAGQIEGLQGGSLDWVGGLTAEQKQVVEASAELTTSTTATNDCYELQIRCDQGPSKELAFRQALLYGTDRQAIADSIAPGVGRAGNGTLVGPAYSSYYLDESIPYDPEQARQLLAQAGYADGVTIELVCQTADPVPALALAWQAQMKEIGVTVDIQEVPPEEYYADTGQDTWHQADFSFVDWGTCAQPVLYFQLAMTSTGAWNYSRWSNQEFDDVANQIPQTLDETQRAALYERAQRILQTEVPMINVLIREAVAGQSKNVDGIELSPDWAQTPFRTAHFTE